MNGVVHAEPQKREIAGPLRLQPGIESRRRFIGQKSRRVPVLKGAFPLDPLERRQDLVDFVCNDDIQRPFEEAPFPRRRIADDDRQSPDSRRGCQRPV